MIDEDATAEELRRRLVKNETKNRANTLNELLGNDGAEPGEKLQELAVDNTEHLTEVLGLNVKEITDDVQIGEFSEDEEIEPTNVELIDIQESDSEENKEEDVFGKIRSRQRQTKIVASPRMSLRSGRKRKLAKNPKSPPKKKRLLDRISSGRVKKSDVPKSPPGKNSFTKKHAERYRFRNLSKEEQEKKRAEAREERRKKREAQEEKKPVRSKPDVKEQNKKAAEESEEQKEEAMIVKIQRPPKRQRKGKTHTRVQMGFDTPFELVLNQLKEKWEVQHIILKFDGEIIDPRMSPREANIENGDLLDADFPEGATFEETFELE